MKINYLIKATPFLSTLLIIIFLSISNQKEYAKLRILIWNTPSITLGKYLSISTGTGFIISYLITTNLSRLNKNIPKDSLNYKNEKNISQSIDFRETNERDKYDNTLIERDIKDPSPTINASFRIIGKSEDRSTYINNNVPYDENNYPEDETDEYTENDQIFNEAKSLSNDWNDDSYSRW